MYQPILTRNYSGHRTVSELLWRKLQIIDKEAAISYTYKAYWY